MAPETKAPHGVVGELAGVFGPYAERLEAVQEALSEKRRAFREALEVVERTGAEAAAIRSELDSLPDRMAAADLEGDEDEKDRIRERRRELLSSLEAVEKERQKALAVFGGTAPWQARSVAYQKASREADDVMREALELRVELGRALDAAFSEVEERAERVHRIRRAHAATRGAS